MNYLLGIDFGGGSAKATLLTEDGRIAAQAGAEYPTYHPKNGYCEQKPEDFGAALDAVTRGILSASGIRPEQILAVAVDSATHTAVLCDAASRPLRDAIHWTDSRSQEQAKRLLAAHGDRIFALTYHKPDTIWTLPQLLWVKENEPEIFSRIWRIYFEKDYIRFLLTGVFCTDQIEAHGSMLYDAAQGKWSEELCALIGLDQTVLPPVVAPTDQIGTVTDEGAARTGLLRGTPVICGTTDTVMEILASGAVTKGDTTVKLATAGRICVITDRAYPDRDLVNYPHVADGLWYPGTATKAAASSFRWFRDTFGGDYAELDDAAAQIPVGCEGLLYHPYLNGELTPYADPMLCGSFVGIRSTHTKAHFARSVLEGVAFSLLASKRKLAELGIACAPRAILIGGGAKSPLWRQIVADCLNLELAVTESSDSSLGSAMLAGVATGVFSSFADAVKRCVHICATATPDLANAARYAALYTEYEAVHDALAPLYQRRQL